MDFPHNIQFSQNKLSSQFLRPEELDSWRGPVSHPLIEPGALPAEGSVDFVEDIVVTPAPAQEVSDQRVQPDLGGTEKGVESQVELTLLEKPVT